MKNSINIKSRLIRWLGCSAAVVCALMLGGRAEAMLIADENFEYGSGPLAGDNGGTGWGSAWQVWFGSAAVNNQQATVSGNTWAYRALAAPVTLSAGDQVWFSFLGNETSPVTTYAGLSAFSGWNERGFVGDSTGAPNTWRIQPSGLPNGSQVANSGVPANAQSLLVERYAIGVGGAGTMTLWVDPASAAQLVDQSAVAVGTFTAASMQFDTIRLASGNGAMSFDDIRVGTTAMDVYPSVAAVPEPGMGILFGLGFVGIVVLRYRAHKRGLPSAPISV